MAISALLFLACDGAGDTTPKDSDTGLTVDTSETADTEETGDSTLDPCPSGATATFTGTDGSVVDHTDALLTGTYVTLDQPGTLAVCPGTWFARLLVRADVTIEGLGAGPQDTILSGGESGTVVDVLGPDLTATVRNVTLDRGVGLDEAHNSGGGGLFCEGYAEVVVESVVFSNNFANDGAGMYVTDCGSTLTDAQFVDNVSEDDGGSFTVWYSETTLNGVTFTGNSALDGGAMALFYAVGTLTDTHFEGNSATHVAGAAWIYKSSIAATDSSFVANDNPDSDSGALLVYGDATLERVSFTGNTAARGGALYVYYDAVIDAVDCSFADNTDDDIWVSDSSEAGGTPHTVGGTASFTCAANSCEGI